MDLDKLLTKIVVINDDTQPRRGRPKTGKIANPTDKIQCDICGVIYSRANAVPHKKTRFHQSHDMIINKFTKIFNVPNDITDERSTGENL